MKKLLASLGLAALMTLPAVAGTQTVTLAVPTMTCPTCPIAVKKALSRVEGVIEVKATWEPKEAVVTFDDTKTTPEALSKATADIGFPSTLKK